MRGKTVRIALLLALLHFAVLLAGFLAPYHFAAQHRNYPYAPPSRIHFRDAGGSFHIRPFVYALVPDFSTGSYREDSRTAFPIRLLVPAREEPASGLLPFPVRLFGVDPPGVLFLLGSDGFGRDVFSRLLYGAQISLFTGLLAASLAVGIGLVCGTVAGYFGGVTDQIMMRGGELFLALPWLYLLLGVRALLPLHIIAASRIFTAGRDYRRRGMGAAGASGTGSRSERPRTRFRPGSARFRRFPQLRDPPPHPATYIKCTPYPNERSDPSLRAGRSVAFIPGPRGWRTAAELGKHACRGAAYYALVQHAWMLSPAGAIST